MPETMIERVARGIWEERRRQAAINHPDLPPLEEWGDGKVPMMNGIIGEARAAVEAMREPSDAMYTAMAWEENGQGFSDLALIWGAGIDAILSEKPSTGTAADAAGAGDETVAPAALGDRATARMCWEMINAMIVPGQLPGNGTDKTAQRNGLILAANVIWPLAFGDQPREGT